jgi:hypothetical protein
VIVARNVHPVLGELRPGALARSDHLPERFWVSSISWEAAAHANDGNGLHIVYHTERSARQCDDDDDAIVGGGVRCDGSG